MPTGGARPHDNVAHLVSLGLAMMQERISHRSDDQNLRVAWTAAGGTKYLLSANVNKSPDHAAYWVTLFRNDSSIRERYLLSPDGLREIALALVQRETGRAPKSIQVSFAYIETNDRKYVLSSKSQYMLRKQLLEYTERDKFSTVRLRSRDLGDHRVYRDAATEWTLPPVYRGVQDGIIRRVPSRFNVEATTRDHLSAYMTLIARRAPVKPREMSGVHLLWRGIHGKQAESFLATGRTDNTGFVATSYDKKTAEGFAKYGSDDHTASALLCLPVKYVPRGTPWIWFDHDVDSTLREREVLLPPGTLQALSRQGDYWVVRYLAGS